VYQYFTVTLPTSTSPVNSDASWIVDVAPESGNTTVVGENEPEVKSDNGVCIIII
jgi:hypothetical protein